MNGTVTVHIAGFTLAGTDETSAWFNGGFRATRDIPPVSLPAAVWLLGSGLLGLIALGRRKKDT